MSPLAPALRVIWVGVVFSQVLCYAWPGRKKSVKYPTENSQEATVKSDRKQKEGRQQPTGEKWWKVLTKHAHESIEQVDPALAMDLEQAGEELGKELDKHSRWVSGLWNGVKDVWQETIGEARDVVADAVEMVSGSTAEVVSEVQLDMALKVRDAVSSAFSEGNLQDAYEMWGRVQDNSVVLGLMATFQDGLKDMLQKYLLSLMSERSLKVASTALTSTEEIVLHLRDKGRGLGWSDEQIMCNITLLVCDLESTAETAYTRLGPWFPSYREYVEPAIKALGMPRVTLSVAASLLHDMDPQQDPFLATLIAAYSAGHISTDLATNLISFFSRVVVTPELRRKRTKQPSTEDKLSALVLDLLSPSQNCTQIGDSAYQFCGVAKRALKQHRRQQSELPTPKQAVVAGSQCSDGNPPTVQQSAPTQFGGAGTPGAPKAGGRMSWEGWLGLTVLRWNSWARRHWKTALMAGTVFVAYVVTWIVLGVGKWVRRPGRGSATPVHRPPRVPTRGKRELLKPTPVS